MSEYDKKEQGKAMEFVPQKHSLNSPELASLSAVRDPFDKAILAICLDQGKMAAVKYCKTGSGWSFAESKKYVDSLISKHSLKNRKEGCFIATACYGDYDAYEVIVLRKYRDNVLAPNIGGRLFIKLYYQLSPVLVRAIGNSERVKIFLRVHFLNRVVNRIEKNFI